MHPLLLSLPNDFQQLTKRSHILLEALWRRLIESISICRGLLSICILALSYRAIENARLSHPLYLIPSSIQHESGHIVEALVKRSRPSAVYIFLMRSDGEVTQLGQILLESVEELVPSSIPEPYLTRTGFCIVDSEICSWLEGVQFSAHVPAVRDRIIVQHKGFECGSIGNDPVDLPIVCENVVAECKLLELREVYISKITSRVDTPFKVDRIELELFQLACDWEEEGVLHFGVEERV